VNLADNGFLDHRSKAAQDFGYAVFGKVIEGMDVVDKMKAVKTGSQGPFSKDAPLTPIVIQTARRA
jgi:peptidyl-prolyl cis-trans isomerase B (cyclophilin B)